MDESFVDEDVLLVRRFDFHHSYTRICFRKMFLYVFNGQRVVLWW